MSVKSEPYYWVECDGDRCAAKVPDGDEYTACADRQMVIDIALEQDWVQTAAGEFYCDDCATTDHKDRAHLVSNVRGETLPGLTP